MTRSIFIVVICLATFLSAAAQTGNPANAVSLSIGPAFPVGHFSSTASSSRLSGYATMGESISLSLAHTISRQLGVVATVYAQRNGINTNAMAKDFSGTSIPFYYNGGGPNTYPNWRFANKSWYAESVLIGLCNQFVLKPGSKFSLSAKAQMGIAGVQLPALSGNSKTDTSFVLVSQNSASAIGLSYMGAIAGNYTFHKNFFFLFNVSYFGVAAVHFKHMTETLAATNGGLNVPGVYSLENSTLPAQALSVTSDYKQPIGVLNLHVGIGLHF